MSAPSVLHPGAISAEMCPSTFRPACHHDEEALRPRTSLQHAASSCKMGSSCGRDTIVWSAAGTELHSSLWTCAAHCLGVAKRMADRRWRLRCAPARAATLV